MISTDSEHEANTVMKLYLGLIDVIVSPDLLFTNSLLINKPLGCLYLCPFGAVNSTKRSDIAALVYEKLLYNGREEGRCSRAIATLEKEP